MLKRDVPIKKGANKGARVFGGVSGLGREDYEGKVYDEKYPCTILKFSSRDEKRGLHPTQKPVELMEYLIKTYTQEGETVLDFAAGSMSTAVACINTNRKGIMVEKDPHYFKVGSERVGRALSEKDLK
jgi:site-specific DNA-methyltransferase (adenine-specific)